MNRELPEHVAELLAEHEVTRGLLCLEITESGFMDDPGHAQKVLDRLAELGVKLSIDDYGTGYSSLSYIMKLPVQELKIDKSFISRMATDEEISTIVRSTIDLGHNLGLQVVAEGVEDLAVWNMLRTLEMRRCAGLLHEQAARPTSAGELDSSQRRASSVPPGPGRLSRGGRSHALTERSALSVFDAPPPEKSHLRAPERSCAGAADWARAIQRRHVRGRGISLVPGKREARITMIEIAHERVARGLGEDRRRADRRHRGIAPDHRLEQALESETIRAGTAIAIDEHLLRRHGRPNKARRIASMVACRILMLSISSASAQATE